MATGNTDESNLFRQLDAYPWEADAEFQSGLLAILGVDPSPKQADTLTRRAKCFYYARYLLLYVDTGTMIRSNRIR